MNSLFLTVQLIALIGNMVFAGWILYTAGRLFIRHFDFVKQCFREDWKIMIALFIIALVQVMIFAS